MRKSTGNSRETTFIGNKKAIRKTRLAEVIEIIRERDKGIAK